MARSLLPDAIASYFDVSPKSHAIVTRQTYKPGDGWQPANAERPAGKRLTGFRRRGVMAISVGLVGDPNRSADFELHELLPPRTVGDLLREARNG